MISTNDFEDLPSFLKVCVGKIQKKYPNYSLNQISNMLDIRKSTLDRIAKAEVQKPSFLNSLKIMQASCDEGSIQKCIKEHYPNMFETFNKVYAGNSDVEFIKPDAEIYFKDPTTYELMLLATSESGVTKDYVSYEYGRKGLEILDMLIENEVLSFNGDKIFCDKKINATQGTVQKLLSNLVTSSYDLESFGNKPNWLSVQYESVNKEKVLPKIKDIMSTAYSEIRMILADKANKGSDVVWTGLVADSFTGNEKESKVLQ